jgi:release factor glutamine methyltransferase
MRISDNRVGSILAFFYQELEGLYEKEEIRMMAFLCMEAFLGFKNPADLVLHAADRVNQSELLKLNFAVKGLKKQRPVQYILGQSVFYHCMLVVNEQVLIPRPETEELVDLIVREQAGKPIRILDIGTGSGCIAIALKKHLPQAEVYAFDIAPGALLLAGENASLNQSPVTFMNWDILNPELQWTGPSFDLIVSNPPYIRLSEQSDMSPNVKDYEPALALFVPNEDPLVFYRNILRFAARNLKPGGHVYFEINQALEEEMKELLQKAGLESVRVLRDMSGKFRIASGIKPVNVA